jgi:hypothetical protein
VYQATRGRRPVCRRGSHRPHAEGWEAINLKIGNAFDVVCERKQTDFRRSPAAPTRSSEDHGAQPQGDVVSRIGNEPVSGTWRMVQSSHNGEDLGWAAVRGAGPRPTEVVTLNACRVRVICLSLSVLLVGVEAGLQAGLF